MYQWIPKDQVSLVWVPAGGHYAINYFVYIYFYVYEIIYPFRFVSQCGFAHFSIPPAHPWDHLIPARVYTLVTTVATQLLCLSLLSQVPSDWRHRDYGRDDVTMRWRVHASVWGNRVTRPRDRRHTHGGINGTQSSLLLQLGGHLRSCSLQGNLPRHVPPILLAAFVPLLTTSLSNYPRSLDWLDAFSQQDFCTCPPFSQAAIDSLHQTCGNLFALSLVSPHCSSPCSLQ